MSAAPAPAPPAEAAAAPPGRGKVVPLALALVCAGLGAGLGLSAPAPKKADEHAKAEDGHPAAPAEPLTWDLPELIVNLANSRGQRYLKVRASVRFRAKDEAAARAVLAKRVPELRDALISLISSKTLEEVEPPEAKESIKLAILDAVNREAFADGSGTAEKLYFLEFIVQ